MKVNGKINIGSINIPDRIFLLMVLLVNLYNITAKCFKTYNLNPFELIECVEPIIINGQS